MCMCFIIVLLLIIDIVIKQKGKHNILIRKKSLKLYEMKFINKLSKYISKNKILDKKLNKCINKLNLINNKDYVENKGFLYAYMMLQIIISLLVGIISIFIFSVWYASIVLIIVSIFFLFYLFYVCMNIKVKKVYNQFPLALQMFTEEYVINKNIKNAFNNSYKKMPIEIGKIFERLSRELNSSTYIKTIIEFSNAFDYIWCYAFCEILIMSYDGDTYDISEELIYLNELIYDEIKEDEETITAISESKSVFVVLNIITTIIFIFNLFLNKSSLNLYFKTVVGNIIIIFWLISIIIGIVSSNVLKKI